MKMIAVPADAKAIDLLNRTPAAVDRALASLKETVS